jgi:hypothetical protein
MSKQLLNIAFISSLLSAALPAVFFHLLYLAIYPIVLVCMFWPIWGFIHIGHYVFQKYLLNKPAQLFICALMGSVGGGIFYALIFSRNFLSYGQEAYAIEVMAPYAFLGFGSAIITWCIYSFGPLRVKEPNAL